MMSVPSFAGEEVAAIVRHALEQMTREIYPHRLRRPAEFRD